MLRFHQLVVALRDFIFQIRFFFIDAPLRRVTAVTRRRYRAFDTAARPNRPSDRKRILKAVILRKSHRYRLRCESFIQVGFFQIFKRQIRSRVHQLQRVQRGLRGRVDFSGMLRSERTRHGDRLAFLFKLRRAELEIKTRILFGRYFTDGRIGRLPFRFRDMHGIMIDHGDLYRFRQRQFQRLRRQFFLRVDKRRDAFPLQRVRRVDDLLRRQKRIISREYRSLSD